MKPLPRLILKCLAILALLGNQSAPAQTTAITYQGRLNDDDAPADGRYDLAFSVWTQATGPALVGNPITNAAVAVSNGLFTATLDFGPGIFDGSERWLQIAVRTNGATDFAILAPRQLITSTPYAIRAGSVSANGIVGQITAPMLAPGAAATNLAGSGSSPVPAGGMILSTNDNDTNLTVSGYSRLGGYVSAPNLWRQKTSTPPMAARQGHSAVWTGSKMLVWGGCSGNDNPSIPPPKVRYIDGGVFDPVTDTWTAMTTNGAPSGREENTAIWTGADLIIWGGYYYDGNHHYFDDGARYRVASNSWTDVNLTNAPAARYRHTAVWTGTEMIIWGGMSSDGGGSQITLFNNGGRYDPASNAWTAINTNGAPSARVYHSAVWTGTEMIVWGGQSEPGLATFLGNGARYNPVTDSWAPLPATYAPQFRARHTAVWTGVEMIVWGGWSGSGPYHETGARYNPATDTWTELEYAGTPGGRLFHTAVWTGQEMVVWGGKCNDNQYPCSDGGAYNPILRIWSPLTTAPRAPLGRREHSMVWTGSELLVFGGSGVGGWYDDTWSCTPPRLLYLYLRQ